MGATYSAHKDPEEFIDNVTKIRWRVVILGLVLLTLDAFDASALSLAIPTLAREWSMPAAAFTFPLTASAISTVIGYMSSGQLSARFGRRRVILWGTTTFAVGSAATVWTTSIAGMSAVRLLTGFGLGLIVPAVLSLAADSSPARHRESIGLLVSVGLAAGPFVAGLSGGALIRNFGWTSPFWAGAALPLLLLPLLWWGIREPAGAARSSAPVSSVGVRNLFADGRGPITVLIWASALLVFVTMAALSAWTPALLIGYGFSPTEAPLGLAALGFGGILGGLTLAVLTTRFRTANVVIATAAIALILIVVLARADLGHTAVLIVIGGIGLAILASLSGPPVIAMTAYPRALLTSGIGWAVAFGRIGSLLGPAFGGALLALGTPARDVVLIIGGPVVLAMVLFVILARRTRMPDQPREAPLQ